MEITVAQLLIGFKSAMPIDGLAEHLGVTPQAVRDRLRTLTPDEESYINAEMGGPGMLTQLEQNILTYESRSHRNKAEYLRGVREHFTENEDMYRTLLKNLVSRQEAYEYAPAAVERLRREFDGK
jgi:predicted ArsR family transcriptional regulator